MIVVIVFSSLTAVLGTQAESIESLLQDFVEAFNSGDYEVMASFYSERATDSFDGRRPDEEDRALHAQFSEMFGALKIQEIDAEYPDGARLLVDSDTAGEVVKFRFWLVGDPPEIDGFSVGIPGDGGHSAGDPGGDHSNSMSSSQADQPFAFLQSAEGVHQSQVVVQDNGSLLLVWVQKGPFDYDLFTAHQKPDGTFSHPLRINHHGLNRYTGDEARPSVALGRDGSVAVAWTAANRDIMLAVGSDYGEVFKNPVKLNQDKGQAYRTMPSTAFSPDGSVHTIWLDPREAPAGQEEPSDLYHARVKDGIVTEENLTARQEPTVCGCCRPYLSIDDDGRFDIVFRNSTGNGYRDISRIVGGPGEFGEPLPTSPPIWKLSGCPMAGPIRSEGGTIWKDASTGSWRLLWSTDANADPEVLLSDGEDLRLTHSPRVVSGRDGWVLIGGKPQGFIMEWSEGSWKIVRDDLPPWTSSAVVHGGRLLLIGTEDGHLRSAVQPI